MALVTYRGSTRRIRIPAGLVLERGRAVELDEGLARWCESRPEFVVERRIQRTPARHAPRRAPVATAPSTPEESPAETEDAVSESEMSTPTEGASTDA